MRLPQLPGMVMTTLIHIGHSDGHYDYDNGGVWVDGALTNISFQGAILPLSFEDMKFNTGGTYTTEDKKLYATIDLKKGDKVVHNGIEYSVLQKKDYTQFGNGLFIYILKRGDNQ